MHHIYHTEGLILSSRNFGEAGKYYRIFTRDLGMINASAQGVRKMSSKLRFILQDFSYVKVDLVKGKDFWRLTSASKTNQLEKLAKDPQKFAIFANISRLLKRLLAGEEPNSDLFDDLKNGLKILETFSDSKDLKNIEALLVLRILGRLGYIGDADALLGWVQSPFGEDLVREADKKRSIILREINKALKETQL
ncbi:MAG TPA: DNA repair protein RecO [Candidatus Paceibacterota bacterium]|nr:DNA repair protein RecO [Candidatus Paceibacterota bacterium]